jgi:predicted phosphohydrolase
VQRQIEFLLSQDADDLIVMTHYWAVVSEAPGVDVSMSHLIMTLLRNNNAQS